jgi:hypothetical protein
MAIEPEVDHTLPEHELDAELAILLDRTQAETAPRDCAHQVALGKVRPLVGELRLRTDEDDLAVEAAVTQTGPHRVAGRAAADDQRSGRVFST